MNIVHHKQIEADSDLRAICREIVAENKSLDEWDRVESCDMFQRGLYCGGFDSIEQEFLFSFYEPEGKEYWFGFSLEIAEKIARGDQYFLDISEAQK